MSVEKQAKILLQWELTYCHDHAGGKLSVGQSNQLVESQPFSRVPVATCPAPAPHFQSHAACVSLGIHFFPSQPLWPTQLLAEQGSIAHPGHIPSIFALHTKIN